MSDQDNTNTKFRLVFLPYVTISALTTSVCALFNLIYIYAGAGFLRVEFLYILAPFIAAVPGAWALYPRFKLFVNRDKRPLTMGLTMFSIIGMGAQSGTLQYYLLQVAGKQIQVHNVKDVLENRNARFFMIDSASADTYNFCRYDTILYNKSGATFRVAIATPLYNGMLDTMGNSKAVWMADNYVLGTYARAGGPQYDEKALTIFSSESLNSFEQTDIKHVVYFTKVLYSINWLDISSALTRCGHEAKG